MPIKGRAASRRREAGSEPTPMRRAGDRRVKAGIWFWLIFAMGLVVVSALAALPLAAVSLSY